MRNPAEPCGTFAEPRGTLRNLPKGKSLRKYKGTLRNPAEPSVGSGGLLTLVAEPGGARSGHQSFRKSKDPLGCKPCWGKKEKRIWVFGQKPGFSSKKQRFFQDFPLIFIVFSMKNLVFAQKPILFFFAQTFGWAGWQAVQPSSQPPTPTTFSKVFKGFP